MAIYGSLCAKDLDFAFFLRRGASRWRTMKRRNQPCEALKFGSSVCLRIVDANHYAVTISPFARRALNICTTTSPTASCWPRGKQPRALLVRACSLCE